MRKVKFPFDLDIIDLVTDDLKKRMLPVNEALKQIDKDRQERAKVRKRVKVAKEDAVNEIRKVENDKRAGINRDPELSASSMASAAAAKLTGADEMVIDSESVPATGEDVKMVGEDEKTTIAGELVDEPTKRAEESQLLRSLVDGELSKDVGANSTGLYELTAIVTHKGASADGGELFLIRVFRFFTEIGFVGHYIGWSRVTSKTTVGDVEDPNKQDWYRFDDEKVSVVPQSKILTLDGGGSFHFYLSIGVVLIGLCRRGSYRLYFTLFVEKVGLKLVYFVGFGWLQLSVRVFTDLALSN